MEWRTLAVVVAAALAAMPKPSVEQTVAGLAAADAELSSQTLQIPPNAHAQAFGRAWVCDSGYRRSAGACVKTVIPENAHATLASWACDHGYRRDGERCLEIDVPGNAFPVGASWECNLGFEKQDDRCLALAEEDRQAQLHSLLSKAPADTTMTPEELWRAWLTGGFFFRTRPTTENARVGRYTFSLHDFVMRCRVYRASAERGVLECFASSSGMAEGLSAADDLPLVAGRCVVHLSEASDPELECSDPQLAIVQERCRAIMTAGPYGRLTCR